MAILGVILPFVLRFFGEGAIGSWLEHRRDMAATAAGREKTRFEHDIKLGEHEIRRRDQQREIQLAEMEHPYLWWGKFILTTSVCSYWGFRFFVKTVGLDDFGLSVSELSTTEATVSGIVITALYLPTAWKKAVRGGQLPIRNLNR